MSEELKEKVKRLVKEGFNKMNLEAFREFYTDKSIRYSPPGPEVVGLENLIKMSFEIRKSFSNTHETILQIVAEGDIVVRRFTWEASHTGQSDIFPIPPTGKQVTMTGCAMHRFKNGKCVEEWEFNDVAGLAMQMGLTPSPE